MSIITGRGDHGETDLLFGKRMAKSSLRAEVLGCVDELNAALGMARASSGDPWLVGEIDQIQTRLFGLMGELAFEAEDAEKYASKGYAKITKEDVGAIETLARDLEDKGVRFTGWAIPGEAGSIERAALDFARTAARRAERGVWRLHESGVTMPETLRIFLNRLSDLLWILARRGD
ncbi:MAG: cob(I)yrinic acid a,c-diamide adenosyltransferase [Luteolibacter sp.]